MPEIVVKSNVKRFTRKLDNIQRKQVPFATSLAINEIAKKAQSLIVARIKKVFNNRKKWWGHRQPTGIKIKFSKKRDLHAMIYCKANFAELQEEGGTKTPKKSKNLAVPIVGRSPKKFQKAGGGREYLKSRKRSFVIKDKGIFRRKSKKKIEMVFAFIKSALVEPRFGFKRSVETVVKYRFDRAFKKALRRAMRTAR
jgi:hypothetical protein